MGVNLLSWVSTDSQSCTNIFQMEVKDFQRESSYVDSSETASDLREIIFSKINDFVQKNINEIIPEMSSIWLEISDTPDEWIQNIFYEWKIVWSISLEKIQLWDRQWKISC